MTTTNTAPKLTPAQKRILRAHGISGPTGPRPSKDRYEVVSYYADSTEAARSPFPTLAEARAARARLIAATPVAEAVALGAVEIVALADGAVVEYATAESKWTVRS